jgi:iron complex outermembrane receptor protein
MCKLYKAILIAFLLFSTSLFAQFKISGVVTDAATGDKLIGANVYLTGTSWGAATDANGEYSITVDEGLYTITCSYIGYTKIEKDIDVHADMTLNFAMTEYQFTLSVEVISDRAKDRETPVAFSNITKKDIQFNLGSQDIPLVLNTTPSLYSTMQGGGAGDSRMNIRGFDQRNIAIMINGVPVNDMENAWVYWSNWDGLGDVASSIQIQRGLSATTLATPSVGGVVNVITDPTRQKAGVMYQSEIGSGNFTKQTLYAHTGLIDNKFALSLGGVHKVGDGEVDKTYTNAWAYYLGASYQINDKNRLELYALGAPQKHGQNLYKLNLATYSHKLARELGFPEMALREKSLREQGILYNSNWNSVSTSYQGLQWERSYWNNSINQRYDPSFIAERENYFHKPIVNLNWYSQFSPKTSLYSTLYWSGGQGGGTGTFGHLQYNYGLLQRVVDWDATISSNRANVQSVDFGNGATDYIVSNDDNGGILRNSVNTQWTWGLISKLFWKATQNLNLQFGIDARIASIDHYREVRDLLGNDYFYWDGNMFESGTKYYKILGDKIDYYNTNDVKWAGGYVQGEYTRDRLTFYATAGYSMVKYDFTDHFIKDAAGGERNIASDWISGYQFKGGASFRINPMVDVYANAGYVAKVPIFDQVIDDVTGTKVPDPQSEKFLSFELGVNSRLLQNKLTVKLNGYFTVWTDRYQAITVTNTDGSDGFVRLNGIDERNAGIELDAAYQPIRFVRFDVAASQGFWVYTDDVSGRYIPDQTDPSSVVNYIYALKDLKVGDQPQTQLAASVTCFWPVGLQTALVWRFYDTYYSAFDPFTRTDRNDRTQVWQIPSYNLLDFHVSYTLPAKVAGMDVTVFGHVFNVLNELYVQEATDNSSYNGYKVNGQYYQSHSASSAEVYVGMPTTFNAGFRVGL